jgi:hypothetical protein
MRQIQYKGRTVTLYGGMLCDYRYEIDGLLTIRGNKGRPTARAAWKAAKAEINRNAKQQRQ